MLFWWKKEDIGMLELFKSLQEYFPEYIFWEPETIYQVIGVDQSQVPLKIREKVEALKAFLRNNLVWTDWHIFENAVILINNQTPNFNVIQRPRVREVAYAVDILNKIKEEKFSEEVAKYIAAVARDRGLIVLPENLSFAQKYLDILYPDKEIKDMQKKVKLGWEMLKEEDYRKMDFDMSDPIDVQLARLLEIKIYIDKKGEIDGN